MGKLCPVHKQPYQWGVCPLCEQRGPDAPVDYKAECRRLNADKAALARRVEELEGAINRLKNLPMGDEWDYAFDALMELTEGRGSE